MPESAINPTINDQYPRPGDNDSQVFRDNFATIKSSLASAKTELSDLLSTTIRSNVATVDLNGTTVENQTVKNTTKYRHDITGLQTKAFDIDYTNGTYQTVQIGADIGINFINFPVDTTTDETVGRLRLHIAADSTTRKIEFTATNAVIKYPTGFPLVNSTKLNIPGSLSKDPVVVDVWQVNNNKSTPTIYIKYVDAFQ
jgi:hypothetical protein